jgi:DNA-binding NarL/FixJ family response regulator
VATGASGVRKPRVILADDQAATLTLLEQLLQSEFDVVASVCDGQTLVETAARLVPDAIVTDISMPGLNGIEAARRILLRDPSARIVFVTVHIDPLLIRKGLDVGGLGYVSKVSAGEELVPAVWAALRGERWGQCTTSE